MHGYSNIQVAVLIVGALALVGIIVSLMQRSATLAGYQEIAEELQKIARTLKAETFRDGDDVVITGNYKQRPLQIRFSNAENMPGLIVRMGAPVAITFSVVPKGERASTGRVLVRTGNDMFDARFASRTDQPTEAKMLVGSRSARAQLEKLCCGSKTFLALSRGNIELTELLIPAPYTDRHVLDHVEQMGNLAASLAEMPGAEEVKVLPYKREGSSPLLRGAMAVGVIAVMIITLSKQQQPVTQKVAANVDTGIPVNDASKIPNLRNMHALKEEDFDPDAAAWLRGQEAPVSGRIQLDLNGDGVANDVAYLLVSNDGKISRVVLLVNGDVVFDRYFPNAVGIARIPKDELANYSWKSPTSISATGDGVLVLLKKPDGITGAIIVPQGAQYEAEIPQNFADVSLL